MSRVSENYAVALLDIAKIDNRFEEIKFQLSEIAEVLKSSQDLRVVLTNSAISISKKIEIIEEIFSNKIDKKLVNFLKILVEKNRFVEFDEIRVAFDKKLLELSNKKVILITSAIELSEEHKSNIVKSLTTKLNSEIIPTWIIDDSIIAGLTFKFDDCIIDSSIGTKLRNLSKKLNG